MGSCFGCFRFRREGKRKTRLRSSPTPSKTRGSLASNDELVSVLEYGGSSGEQFVHLNSWDIIDKDVLERELKDEAKFLKYCGALLETPIEIRKPSEKSTIKALDKDGENSNFRTWFPATSFRKLFWDKQFEESSSSENNSSGFISQGHQALRDYDDHHPSATTSKSAHSEGVEDSSVKSGLDTVAPDTSSSEASKRIQSCSSKYSPYPTPLKVTDEMQTPATTHPTNRDYRTGKCARVRTQYVYPVLNPVENLLQWKELKDKSRQHDQSEKIQQLSLTSSSEDLMDKRIGKKGAFDKENPVSVNSLRSVTPPPGSRGKEILYPETPQLLVSSLSQWLKPFSNEERRYGITSIEELQSQKSPVGGTPFLESVATNLNGYDQSCSLPKWHGGNGIPNSTTKYKEDQKVSWHATPFEERLERVLSDDKLFPKRQLVNRKMAAFEDEVEKVMLAS